MRTTISLDPAVAKLAKRAAKTERRNFSNLVEVALAAYITPAARPTPEAEAALELRTLGACPVMALRDKIAEVQRDQFLSTTNAHETENQLPAPPAIPATQLRHPPAPSRILAGRATQLPALRLG